MLLSLYFVLWQSHLTLRQLKLFYVLNISFHWCALYSRFFFFPTQSDKSMLICILYSLGSNLALLSTFHDDKLSRLSRNPAIFLSSTGKHGQCDFATVATIVCSNYKVSHLSWAPQPHWSWLLIVLTQWG